MKASEARIKTINTNVELYNTFTDILDSIWHACSKGTNEINLTDINPDEVILNHLTVDLGYSIESTFDELNETNDEMIDYESLILKW